MATEVERAAKYESEGDTAARWGDETRPPSERRRLPSMISVRVTTEELKQIKHAADRAGVSTSAFLRGAALRAALGVVPASGTSQTASPSGNVKMVVQSGGGNVESDFAGAQSVVLIHTDRQSA